jgi:hypothetical protein
MFMFAAIAPLPVSEMNLSAAVCGTNYTPPQIITAFPIVPEFNVNEFVSPKNPNHATSESQD